jgi:anti-sigma factor (TIGR02949 family)
MDCKKVLSLLSAYLDGEVPEKLMRDFEQHLSTCRSCSSQLELIRQVDDMFESLSVPPLPEEFVARVMVKAQRNIAFAKEEKAFFPFGWQPFQWLLDLSTPMRLAACVAVFLASLVGMYMSKELSQSRNHQNLTALTENLDGFEWFSLTPPTSLGSAYLVMALTAPEDRGVR